MEPAWVKLSDALEEGARHLATRGPTWAQDIWVCAQAAEIGRVPTPGEACTYYHHNQWMQPGNELEWWARLILFDKPKWSQVIAELRKFGG